MAAGSNSFLSFFQEPALDIIIVYLYWGVHWIYGKNKRWNSLKPFKMRLNLRRRYGLSPTIPYENSPISLSSSFFYGSACFFSSDNHEDFKDFLNPKINSTKSCHLKYLQVANATRNQNENSNWSPFITR